MKKNIRLFSNKKALKLIILARVVTPFSIFINPAIAVCLSLFFDGIDGQFFYENKYKWRQYNTMDKVLDLWWYLFLVMYLYSSGNSQLFVALILLLYRCIGQCIGVFLSKENVYIFFPNMFEWFSLLAIFTHLSLGQNLLISAIFSLFVEWLIHHSNAHIISKYIIKNEVKW